MKKQTSRELSWEWEIFHPHSEFVRERLQECDFHGCVYLAASLVEEHRLGSSEFPAVLLNVGIVKGPQAEFSPWRSRDSPANYSAA